MTPISVYFERICNLLSENRGNDFNDYDESHEVAESDYKERMPAASPYGVRFAETTPSSSVYSPTTTTRDNAIDMDEEDEEEDAIFAAYNYRNSLGDLDESPTFWTVSEEGVFSEKQLDPPVSPLTTRRPPPNPYLGWKAYASQSWINPYTLAIVLIIVKLINWKSLLEINIVTAGQVITSSCESMQNAGTALASVPHYAAQTSNELIALGVEKSVQAALSILLDLIEGIGEMIFFIINLLTGTYVCLGTMIIDGVVDMAVNVTEAIVSFVNGSLANIIDYIDDDITAMNSLLNSTTQQIDNIATFFSAQEIVIPPVNIPSVGYLKNFTIPSSVNDKIQSLTTQVPTYESVENATKSLIMYPFNELTSKVNDTLGNYSFDKTALNVPGFVEISLCSSVSGQLDQLLVSITHVLRITLQIIFIILLFAALVCTVTFAYLDYWHFTRMNANALLYSKATSIDQEKTSGLVQFCNRPFFGKLGLKLANFLTGFRDGPYIANDDSKTHDAITDCTDHEIRTIAAANVIRWYVSYVSTDRALFILGAGLIGIVMCALELYLLTKVETELPVLSAQLSTYSNELVGSLTKVQSEWVSDTNSALANVQDDINNDLFGWITTATESVNNTLNTFVDDMSIALNETFGDTILLSSVTGVINCLVTTKIDGIQKGLTWVNDRAHVSLPRLDPSSMNLFGLNGSASVDGISMPSSSDLETIEERASAALGRGLNYLRDQVKNEMFVSVGCILVWMLVAVAGLSQPIRDSTSRLGVRGHLIAAFQTGSNKLWYNCNRAAATVLAVATSSKSSIPAVVQSQDELNTTTRHQWVQNGAIEYCRSSLGALARLKGKITGARGKEGITEGQHAPSWESATTKPIWSAADSEIRSEKQVGARGFWSSVPRTTSSQRIRTNSSSCYSSAKSRHHPIWFYGCSSLGTYFRWPRRQGSSGCQGSYPRHSRESTRKDTGVEGQSPLKGAISRAAAATTATTRIGWCSWTWLSTIFKIRNRTTDGATTGSDSSSIQSSTPPHSFWWWCRPSGASASQPAAYFSSPTGGATCAATCSASASTIPTAATGSTSASATPTAVTGSTRVRTSTAALSDTGSAAISISAPTGAVYSVTGAAPGECRLFGNGEFGTVLSDCGGGCDDDEIVAPAVAWLDTVDNLRRSQQARNIFTTS